jgi:thiamine monophosphate synthase
VSLPVFAIGGIDAARLRRMAPLPLAGVAVIGAVVSAADMREAVARLKEAAL